VYTVGDGVTRGGSLWIAEAETSEVPGEGSTKWRLAVKKGQDGKAGPKGEAGDRGPQGPKGDDGKSRY
jgi:collagen type III alpha